MDNDIIYLGKKMTEEKEEKISEDCPDCKYCGGNITDIGIIKPHLICKKCQRQQ